MQFPLVSVIIITYNHESYIEKALDSVLQQKTSFNFEIIIGDDCSLDATPAILMNYQKKYPEIISIILHPNNLGATQNEYQCIKLAKGKYIALLEGDDFWTISDKLQLQVDWLEANPTFGMVHTDANHLYENSNHLIENYNRKKKILIPEGNILDDLLGFSFLIHTMTVLFHKDLLEVDSLYNLILERKWQLTDLVLWLHISAKSKIHYLNITSATYRLRNESASRTNNWGKKNDFHKSVFEIKLYYCEKYNTNKLIKNRIKKQYFSTMLYNAIKMKNKKLANNIICEAKQLEYDFSIHEFIQWNLLLLKSKFIM